MYSHCLRCSRSLGRNSELAHLPIGRCIAFDRDRGRVWVICTRCRQWNLLPLEERWEALEEAERIATTAESRVEGGRIGLARTTDGLELLRASGLPNADIANWRYGRRLQQRRSLLWWIAGASMVLSVVLGARAGLASGSRDVGIYAGLFAAVWFGLIWRDPPRLLMKIVPEMGAPERVWQWQLSNIRFERSSPAAPPSLVVPRRSGELHLQGPFAAAFLASFFPRVNGSACNGASIDRAVARVAEAERKIDREPLKPHRKRGRRRMPTEPAPAPVRPLRPWERLAVRYLGQPLLAQNPEQRLALEMAVTEEVEGLQLSRRATAALSEWPEQEEIAAIADDLLIPESIRERLAESKRSHK